MTKTYNTLNAKYYHAEEGGGGLNLKLICGYTSEISLTAAASTMFLMTNFLMALSLGQA